MKYFPLFADLENASVLVAGGGEQAAQKVRLLRKTRARITVVAEAVTEELRALGEQGAIRIVPRAFQAGDLEGQRLVYAATGDRARRRGRLAGGQGAQHPGQRGRCARSCPPSSRPPSSIAHP